MPSTTPAFAPEMIACIQADRPPTADELTRVADHIRADLAAARPAFAWGDSMDGDAERLLVLRVAKAALTGNRGA